MKMNNAFIFLLSFLILFVISTMPVYGQQNTWTSGIFTDYLDIGASRNSGSRLLGLNIGRTSYNNFQYAFKTWGGSHALLFNAYMSANQIDGSLATTGNTKYANDVGAFSGTAGAIMFFGNGGVLNFYVSPVSTGQDTNIVWGVPKMSIRRDGNIGIGTTTPSYKLEVAGTIRSQEVKVEAAPWPDYVFSEDYDLPSLEETEAYIKANKHLPGIPSAEEVAEEGIALGEMNAKLLRKMEELTLHIIDQNKHIVELETKLENGVPAQTGEKVEELMLYVIELKKELEILKGNENNKEKR